MIRQGAMMNPTHQSQAPWSHRLLVCFFSLLFALLVYWLLGFVVRDIATWPGPDYAALEAQMIDPSLRQEAQALREQIEESNRLVNGYRQRQAVLRDSTANSERTMNQLLELQKLNLQKNLAPTEADQRAFDESRQLFLDHQKKYQEINDQIATATERLESLERQQRQSQKRIEEQRRPVQEAYARHSTLHQLKLALGKLSVLLPLLAFAVWLFVKKRGGLYAPMIYGFGLAVLVKVGMVMHEHFPRRYFKYILTVAALLLAARVLVYLLRLRAFPKPDWLLKQRREAYERFRCPVCGYPIRRGPLKFIRWSRRNLRRIQPASDPSDRTDEPYICPVCATSLFEECPACKGIRHSLLPACTHCGAPSSPAQSPRPGG